MGLTISEATDVNTLLQWVLDEPGPGGQRITGDKARTAARNLAAKAHKTLGAGLTEKDITDGDFNDPVSDQPPGQAQWEQDAPGPLVTPEDEGRETFEGGVVDEDDEAAAIEAAEAHAAAEGGQP